MKDLKQVFGPTQVAPSKMAKSSNILLSDLTSSIDILRSRQKFFAFHKLKVESSGYVWCKFHVTWACDGKSSPRNLYWTSLESLVIFVGISGKIPVKLFEHFPESSLAWNCVLMNRSSFVATSLGSWYIGTFFHFLFFFKKLDRVFSLVLKTISK